MAGIKPSLDHIHPSIRHFVPLFEYGHLPERLQAISKPFCDLALDIIADYPSNPETTVCLRKLLEAKDCAVRAKLIG